MSGVVLMGAAMLPGVSDGNDCFYLGVYDRFGLVRKRGY